MKNSTAGWSGSKATMSSWYIQQEEKQLPIVKVDAVNAAGRRKGV
jgi:hypothetical protein